MTLKTIAFPPNFLWGAAASAYQIEGATMEVGRGESIWDRFSHTAGTTFSGHTGDGACDHYHRLEQDVALMKQLGLKAYRFSIAWPRIFPDGRSSIERRGLDFYSRLVDLLLAAGIQPCATLYHWDLPQALQDIGGWSNRTVVDAFGEYAQIVACVLGDRVKHWTTINDPWAAAFLGNKSGEHAPGIKDEKTALSVAHGLLLGHGKALQAIRSQVPDAQVGIALALTACEPESTLAADYIAAERKWQEDAQWFLHPLLRAQYPEALFHHYGNHAPDIAAGDLKLIAAPMDFLGVNYYRRVLVGANGVVSHAPGARYTESGWEVRPQSLRSLLARITHDYRNLPPLYILENGAAFKDTPAADGTVNDIERASYICEHLYQAHVAMEQGVNLKGYFVRSLMDGFEWADGYSKHFGLISTDAGGKQRQIKTSGHWYQKMIAAGGRFNIEVSDAPQVAAVVNMQPANATYALPAVFPTT